MRRAVEAVAGAGRGSSLPAGTCPRLQVWYYKISGIFNFPRFFLEFPAEIRGKLQCFKDPEVAGAGRGRRLPAGTCHGFMVDRVTPFTPTKVLHRLS